MANYPKDIVERVYAKMKDHPLIWGLRYLEHHFRDQSPSFHLKILIECLKNRFFAVAAPRESAKCVDGNTLISMSDGGEVKIKDIKVGDSVVGVKGGKVIDSVVMAKHSSGVKECFRVDIGGGRSVRTTRDHRFLTLDGWKQLKDLSVGDYVILPNKINSKVKYNGIQEEARFLAYMIAEGSLSSGNCGFTNFDSVLVSDFSKCCKVLGFKINIVRKGHYRLRKGWNAPRAYLKRLDLYGKNCKEKRIPNSVFMNSPEYKKDFISVFFDTDGFVTQNCIGITLANEGLIDDLRRLMLHFGIYSRKRYRGYGKFNAWGLTIHDRENVNRFKDSIKLRLKQYKLDSLLFSGEQNNANDLFPPEWRERLSNSTHYFRKHGIRIDNKYPTNRRKVKEVAKIECNQDLLELLESDYYFDKIKSVKSVGNTDTYDIQTTSDSFIGDGVYLHNSTIITMLRPAHGIAFKKYRFIIICQNTFTKAAGSLDTIKAEFKDNHLIKKDFRVKIMRDASGDSIFKHPPCPAHPTGYETRVLCKGADQIGSVRGEKFGAYRPDLILIDDLEDDELVRNPDRRRELRRLVDDALLPAGDRKVCEVNVVGTILHDDSVMAKFVSRDEYKEFRKLFYVALWHNPKTGEEESLWPQKWTVEELKKLERDKPETFAKEYQNNPVSGIMAKFHREDFRYWKIQDNEYILFDDEMGVKGRGPLSECRAVIGCDLAWEAKRGSDFTAIVPMFMTPESDVLVDDYVCRKGVDPDEIEEILFSMEERLKVLTGDAVYIGFEKAMFEKVMKWLLKEAMRRRNRFLNFKPVLWDGDKIKRIVTRLQPRYAQHVMYHKHGMGELENQLLRIPSGTHDDAPDALSAGVSILDYAPTRKSVRAQSEDPGWDILKEVVKPARKGKFFFGSRRSKRSVVPTSNSLY